MPEFGGGCLDVGVSLVQDLPCRDETVQWWGRRSYLSTPLVTDVPGAARVGDVGTLERDLQHEVTM